MEMIDFERNAMQVNKTNQMVFLKNVESNIIKDAWIMLRENVSYKENNKETLPLAPSVPKILPMIFPPQILCILYL